VGTGAEERARLLADLASALTAASTDLDRVLDRAVSATSRLLGDGSVVRLVNDDGVYAWATVHHADPEQAETLRRMLPRLGQRADDGQYAAVRAAHGPLVRNDITEEQFRVMAGPLFPHLRPPYWTAVLAVPLRADGEYLGTLSSLRTRAGRPFTDEDAQLATDIAARVALAVAIARSVSRLRAERENYRQIVETTFEGVWRIDRAGVTTFVNGRLAEMVGTSPDGMTGRPAARWLEDADPADRLRRPPPAPERYSVRLRRADGGRVWAELTASPMRDEMGAVVGTLVMVSDVTDRVRNRELRERLAQMERLDSIGQLAGGIAHDFNNLLSIVGGAVELMLPDLPAGSPVAVLARQVAAAVDQGAALTRQLLTFGRGRRDTGGVVDVGAVVRELEPMLRRTLGEHIELHAPAASPEEGERPCRVRIERGHLEQVIVNLATNARDAMEAGGTLTLECEHVLLDRAELGEAAGEGKAWFVRLAISDTGTGMDADTLRHAFEPFYTTKPPGQGTGLGLASAYGIVRAADGLVRLYSEPGQGLAVKIYLPASDETACDGDQAEAADEPAEPAPLRATAAAGARILVVEDTPALADVTRRLLQPAGYVVEVAHSPTDALARLDAGLAVDLVITDVVMPKLSGPELAEQIHARQPDLPVIYTSGYPAGVLGRRAQLPRDAILVEKPFTRANLLGAVAEALCR
jgi:PAS domain S-box-containing protein